MSRRPRIYIEERFRTPLAQERALGLWADRIGRRRSDASRPDRFRVLGQYAAVAVELGAGVLETEAHGRHDVAAGDTMLLFPREATRYYARGGAWDTCWMVWNGPEAAVLEQLGCIMAVAPVVRGGAPAVLRAWDRMGPLMARQDRGALLERKITVLDLVRELDAAHRSANAPVRPAVLEAALRVFTGGAVGGESVMALARRLRVSPAHFRRLFKLHTGASPKAFQTAQRITRAKELLSAGRSIKETSAMLGFTDVFHFMRVFRHVTGETAGQFSAGRRQQG